MMNKRTILVVEDERTLAAVVCEYLQHGGYSTVHLSDGSTVVDWMRNHHADLLVLDLMLPNQDGLAIYRELRTFCDTPVIMATAKVDEVDRLTGLQLGADDYLCKPYSPRELVMRIRNILRRSETYRETQCISNKLNLKIDETTMQATINGKVLALTAVEFRLLVLFHSNPERAFTREQLINQLYDDYRIVSDRTVDSHIRNLRKKLYEANPNAGDCVQSVYGIGYRWFPDSDL